MVDSEDTVSKEAKEESGYSQEYYEEHKEEIRKKRRERYRNDPVYREKIRARARDRRRRLLKDEAEDREKKGKPAPKVGVNKPEWFLITSSGKDLKVRMYTIKYLAKALKVQPNTIRTWSKIGILPPPMYRSRKGKGGSALYTKFQIDQLAVAYAESIRSDGLKLVENRIGSSSFPQRAREFWGKFPLGIDPDHLGDLKEPEDV